MANSPVTQEPDQIDQLVQQKFDDKLDPIDKLVIQKFQPTPKDNIDKMVENKQTEYNNNRESYIAANLEAYPNLTREQLETDWNYKQQFSQMSTGEKLSDIASGLGHLAQLALTGGFLSSVGKVFNTTKPAVITEKIAQADQDIAPLATKSDQLVAEFKKHYDPAPEVTQKIEAMNKIIKDPDISPETKITIAADTQKDLPPIKPADQVANESLNTLDIHQPIEPEIAQPVTGIYSPELSTFDKISGTWRRAVSSTITALRSSNNPAGEELANRIMNYLDIPEVKSNAIISNINRFISPFSNAEKRNLVDVLDAKYYGDTVTPISQRVKDISEYITLNTNKTTDEARTIGLGVAPISKGFFPHQIEDLTTFNRQRSALNNYLIQTGQASNTTEANMLIDTFARRYVDREYAGLERARMLQVKGYDNLKKFGFNTDPISAYRNYFVTANKRIEEVNQFGEKGTKIANELYSSLKQTDPGTADIARRFFLRLTNRSDTDMYAQWAMQKITNWSVIQFMGLSQMMQLLSVGNVYARMGFARGVYGTYKALQSLISKTPKKFAEEIGAVMVNTLEDYRTNLGKGSFSDFYTKISGVNKFDELTRIAAVHSGKSYLQNIVNTLLENPTDRYALKQAKELFLDVPQLLKDGKLTSSNNEKLLLKRLSDTTIGRARISELPLWMGSPYMKFLTLFKNYLQFQSKFVKDHIFKELIHGNIKPLLVGTLVSAPMADVVQQIRGKLKGRPMPKGIDRFVQDILLLQGMGIIGDAVSASTSPGRVASYLTGPNVTQLSNLGYFVAQLMTHIGEGKHYSLKEIHTLKKFLYSQTIKPIPILGPALYANEFPETTHPPLKKGY